MPVMSLYAVQACIHPYRIPGHSYHNAISVVLHALLFGKTNIVVGNLRVYVCLLYAESFLVSQKETL